MAQEDFQIVRRGGLEWLECEAFAREASIVHAFSTRREHSARRRGLNFTLGQGTARDDRHRRRFLRALKAADFLSASLRQIHSANIWQVVRNANGSGVLYTPCGAASGASQKSEPSGDALLTDEPGILLGVRSADCMPILLADVRRQVVAALHAGWRGTLARLIEKAVGEFERTFGCSPEDLIAAIGPSIRACCYEVGEELVDAFSGQFLHGKRFFSYPSAERSPAGGAWLSQYPPGHSPPRSAHLDLVAAARDQLEGVGVKPSRIHVAEFCTACREDLFFSYRRDGERAGRMMAVIGIRPEKRDPERWPRSPARIPGRREPDSIARTRP